MVEEYDEFGPLSDEAKEAAHATMRLSEALRSFAFPITRDELIERGGDIMVEIVEGYPIKLKDLLANCDDERFETMESLLTCRAVQESIRAA